MPNYNRAGFDTSYAKPTGADASRGDRKCAMLYITDPGPGNKGVTQAIWDDYAANHIAMGFVWELSPSAVLSGHAQGVQDARGAQYNLSRLSGPSNTRPLFFGIDFDISNGQLGIAATYFQGVNSVIGVRRTGVYGSGLAIDYLFGKKLVSFGWWCSAASGWGGGHVPNPKNVQLKQVSINETLGSGSVDFDQMASGVNWGQLAVVLGRKPKVDSHPFRADPVTKEHTVQPGESIHDIAVRYGVRSSSIYKWSGLRQGQKVEPGRVLTVQR